MSTYIQTVARRGADWITRQFDFARLLWAASRGWTAAAALGAALQACFTIGTILVIGGLVGAATDAVATNGGTGAVWSWFAAFAGLQIGAQLLGMLMGVVTARAGQTHLRHLLGLIADAGMAPPDLADLEGAHGSRLRALDRDLANWEMTLGLEWTWQVITTRLSAVGSLVIVMAWNWWAGLLATFSVIIINRAFVRWMETFQGAALTDHTVDTRRRDYFRSLLVQRTYAKEVRLFGWAGWLVDQYTAAWRAADRLRWTGTARSMTPVLMTSAASVVAIGATFALLGSNALAGVISVATVITATQGIVGLQQFGVLGDAQTYAAKLATSCAELATLRRNVGLTPHHLDQTKETTTIREGPATVDLIDVAFTYPTRTEPTVRHLQLHVPAGQTLAIVGLNGAGKTTLIKLLCGLYPADAGEIRIGGEPVTGPRPGRVAAIFQDFEHYPLCLRDNVAFGAPETLSRDDSSDQTYAATLELAGGESVMSRIAEDFDGSAWDRVLASEYTAGTDVSGGQWQRIALARALTAVTNGARVLVLDEPTAALDVRAEAELFDRLIEVTTGVTTILVSHRLSTVRRADRIVVLDDAAGRIVEDGTHAELLSADRGYAALFRLQAERFATAGGVTDTSEKDET